MDNFSELHSSFEQVNDSIIKQETEDIDTKCDIEPLVRPSSKLSIVDRIDNERKNKHSIWSDILLEEELVDNFINEFTITESKKLPNSTEKESEKYYLWTQNDFNKRFSQSKINQLVKKRANRVAKNIGKKLNEPRCDIIKNIVMYLGQKRAYKLLADVINIEEAGGIMTKDGSKRRTPGGVFFHLVRNDRTISDNQKEKIFGCKNNNKKSIINTETCRKRLKKMDKKEKIENLKRYHQNKGKPQNKDSSEQKDVKQKKRKRRRNRQRKRKGTSNEN